MRRMTGDGIMAIAEALGRSTTSIKMAAHRYRISLRGPGYRGGLVLGQPRGVSFGGANGNGCREFQNVRVFREIRDDLLAGKIQISELELEATRRCKLARGTPLCPMCARNPQEIERTGLCNDCHLKELARAHRNLEQLRSPQREVWNAKQQNSRRRRGGARHR